MKTINIGDYERLREAVSILANRIKKSADRIQINKTYPSSPYIDINIFGLDPKTLQQIIITEFNFKENGKDFSAYPTEKNNFNRGIYLSITRDYDPFRYGTLFNWTLSLSKL